MTNDVLREWLHLFPPGTPVLMDSEGGEVNSIFWLPYGGLHHHPDHVVDTNCSATLLLNPTGLRPSSFVVNKNPNAGFDVRNESAELVQELPNDLWIPRAYRAYLWYYETFDCLPPYLTAWGPYRVNTVSMSDQPCLRFFEYDKNEAKYAIDLPISL